MLNTTRYFPWFIIFPLLLCSTITLQAQQETLIGDNEIEHGGYGAVSMKFSQLNNEFAFFMGGRGGWIINHSFIIGAGGYGLVNKIDSGLPFDDIIPNMIMGYGGLELEYIVNPNELLHYSFYLLIGGGGINYRHDRYFWFEYDWESFACIEPAVNIELNITSFFRLHFGAGYRAAFGIDNPRLSNDELSGPAATLSLKFGKF